MEYRRLQKSKSGSFLLSIPKEWIKKRGLDSGSLIKLVESEEGGLILLPEGTMEKEENIVTIKSAENLEKQIRTQYLLGANTIIIDLGKKISSMTREEVKNAISKLIGLEIIEEGISSITIQCLLQPTSIPVRSVLKRSYSLAASMHKDAEIALSEGDIELAEVVSKRDEEVDRLYFLIVRQLRSAIRNYSIAEKLGVKPIECLDLRMAARYIEGIADQSEIIAKNVMKVHGEKIDKEIINRLLELSNMAYNIHEEASQALFKGDIKLANKVISKNNEFKSKVLDFNEFLLIKQPKLSTIINSIAMHIYQIGEYGIDLAELVGF
ncbi:MAG: hypothetical protein DSO09_04150 [Candidatus Methanomethylicota archaeon]|jgi:phosphate uptake regulator|uniref:Phosphate uptake regulator PhoU n=1 Tax=Thermoproteota archaeon TaxID=2056631 RepID=A0A523BDC9_9CREN|nr:MAG: phosphate uptake regulator PhoU [Candidatus Verstraetearchaeota archaeon]TDA38470.1 MAG: hypothetical protein DSO09_04150 [Candidatus Verstraetearchaeota archaeon]